ncbi:MAG: FecR family protein [Spirochaetales bacterium]|nr:FecR family protein [Spirochaetales bacterium]
MKKTIILLILFTACSPLWAQVTIDRIQGNVEIQLPGESSWQKAEQGAVLPDSARISTGFNSTARLLVNGETTVSLKALSRLTVEEATRQNNGSQNTKLFLGSGRIRADVRRTDGSIHDFKVGTPVATAAVRGTSFDMGSGTLRVSEGTVTYTVGSYSFSVQRGQSANIRLINGRPGLIPTAEDLLSERQVSINTGGSTADSGSAGKTGYAVIELR